MTANPFPPLIIATTCGKQLEHAADLGLAAVDVGELAEALLGVDVTTTVMLGAAKDKRQEALVNAARKLCLRVVWIAAERFLAAPSAQAVIDAIGTEQWGGRRYKRHELEPEAQRPGEISPAHPCNPPLAPRQHPVETHGGAEKLWLLDALSGEKIGTASDVASLTGWTVAEVLNAVLADKPVDGLAFTLQSVDARTPVGVRACPEEGGDEQLYESAAEAAGLLGVSPARILNAIKSGSVFHRAVWSFV